MALYLKDTDIHNSESQVLEGIWIHVLTNKAQDGVLVGSVTEH